MTALDEIAKAYDPDAFEDHPIERKRQAAAIQWGARRHLAKVAAERLLTSEWIAAHDAELTEKAKRETLDAVETIIAADPMLLHPDTALSEYGKGCQSTTLFFLHRVRLLASPDSLTTEKGATE